MISFLIGIITAAIVFYMSMIYGNAALALLGCFMCVFMVLTFIALLVKAHRAVAAINIPIAIATQGESIRVSLSCRLKEAGFYGVKYRVTVKNNLSGEKSTKWLSGGSDFLYSVNLCGNYEFELVRIKLYDFSRLFYVTKRVKKYANVEVMPQIDEIPVRITDRVRNFFGDSDIYDDLRPGYDPSELFDVREFQNGDRLQSVHWKLSARTDELMVKENSLPKACAVAIVADLRGIKKGRQADAFMKLLVSLSFSLMDQKCSHYVAWYDTAINDIVRARVDDEEGFYIFLNSFLKIKPDTKNDALFLYEEKYRAEKLVCLLSVDGRLQIKRGEEIVGRADEKTRLSFRKSRWQRSDTNEIKPDYNNAFTVLGVLLTELANAAAAVLLTVCAVSVVNTTVSHVRCPYYVYVWLFIFSVISGFINRLTSLDTRKWVRHAINTGLLLVFLLGVFIANWQAAEHIKDGFLYVKGRYLEIINVYYGTSFVCQKGDKAFAGAFVGFVSFIVMLLLVTLAVQIKRRRMLTLFPTLLLAVQLCIGKSPSVSEVVMLTLCTLWCLIADGNARTVAGYDADGSAQGNEALRIAAAFLYMAAVSAVLFICVFSFKPLADTLADKKPQMLAFQKDLEGSVKSFFSVGIDLQDGMVSNHYPSYSEKTVMTIEAKAGVPSNIYLRSFYGDTYENGRWIKKSDFSGMEKEYHDASRMTAWQNAIGLATLLDGYYDDETNPATEKYTITMKKLSTKYTYLPYCIDPYSIDAKGDIDFDEDFVITKDKATKTIEVSACPGFFDGSLEMSILEPEQPLEVNNDFYAAYNDYVMENYTEKQGGDGIVAEDAKWLLRTGQLTSNMMYTGYIRENDANRIAAAQLVQQFLTSKAFKYSKNPPSTGGKDVVENFLSNSRQGFCVHFASAGTMILRQMGVPCRYVSGYCAKEDSFKSGENDEDICEVKDSQSHAWVEIYLDDFGWIPVEMTPGYFEYVTGENPFDYIGVNGKKTNTGAAYNDSEHMNDTAADEDKLDEDAANEDTKNTDAENDDTAKDDTSKAAANSTSGDGSEKAYGSQSGADKRTDAQNLKTRPHIPPVILKTSLCVIFLTALTAIIVYIKRRRNILWEARLAKRVKKGRYSRAAIMINNRIYKGLGHPSKNRTDELYLANLKEKYCGPDYCGIHWDEYMRIIQKAVYSSEGITEEECFMIVETWRRLEKKDIRHNSQKNMYKNSMINKK